MKPERVGIYVRVSTLDKGQDVELQLSDLRAYATARGWATKEYVDIGESGSKERRPSFDRMMDDARKRKIDVILVWRLDRFGRSLKHLILHLDEIKTIGVGFVSFKESLDFTTPTGRLMTHLLAAFAEFEKELIRERVRAGVAHARTKGKKKVPDEIWISQPLFEILSRLKAERGLQKVVGPYVLQKANGKPYGTIKTTWKTCCGKAGVIDAHVHDIRHKAITDMGKQGYSLQEIAKVAGHSQISTTMRYTHLRAEDTREALESLGRRNKSEVGELEVKKPGMFEETRA